MRAARFWVTCAAGLALTSEAKADVAPAPSAESRGYVELTIKASDPDAAALTTALHELIARLGLGLHVMPAPSPPGPLTPADDADRAHVAVDESAADRVDIVVVAFHKGQPEAPVARSLAKGDSPAILTEQVAHVVHATLESLLATEDAAPAAPIAAPTSPPPTSSIDAHAEGPGDHAAGSRPSGRAFGVAATAFATTRGVAGGAGPAFGGGAAVSATAWRGFLRPSFWLSGAYNAPFGEVTDDVTVQTTVTSLRAGANVALVAARTFGLDVGVGAGADVFHTVPGNPAPSVSLGPTMDLVDPVVTTRVLAGILVGAGARVVVGVDVDYDVASHRYVTALASGSHAGVFQPWAARPSAIIGVCLPLVGDLGCAP